MPIYEYLCDACGERLEVMQKISERPLKQCPACKENQLRKLVSASAFRLKGSGWYETDFKKGGKKNLSTGADESGAEKGDKDKEKEKKPAKAEEKADSKESTAETKSPAKEKEKDKSATKTDAGKAKTPNKPASE